MIKAKKSLGQHFLTDPNYINKIADAALLAKAENHVEIGPGTGMITTKLYNGAKKLIVIETDGRVVQDLQERFPGCDVIHTDILKFDWQDLADYAPFAVTGNLPYYITSPILFSLLKVRSLFEHAVLMIQKEVADRIVAKPSTKSYGILSVQFQLFFRVERLFDVPSTVFKPRANVESTVIRLIPQDEFKPAVPEDKLRKLIRAAFAKRRKTLQNNLKAGYEVDRIPRDWRGRRAESMAPHEFVELAEHMFKE